MSHHSKAWLILVCLLSYLFMGQAGCQTTSSNDITYVRSDIVRLRHDIEGLQKTLDSPAPVNTQGILRNQAAQREALLELKDGQQRTESRIEETRYELAALRQEITNLKLNMIRQMEALRAATKRAAAAPAPLQPSLKPKAAAKQAGKPKPSKPKPSAPPKPVEPIDFTKLYDMAYEDYQRENYSLARTGFEEYLRLFSDTDLADNAQYWIGECYYAEGKYEEAAAAFQKVITRYPTGNKVPRAMLKAGHVLLQLGRKDHARSMFQQVIDAYPLSSEADQAKSRLKKLN
jgi:tol-pal system protein YbgF